MSTKLILSYTGGLIVLVALLVVFGSPKAAIQTYSAQDAERPRVMMMDTTKDLGPMTNRDVRQTTFTIHNEGQKDLTLTNVSTSCDCTYAYITTAAGRSDKFTMHGTNKDWVGTVAPGADAQIEVVYEPAIMPVRGHVERTVTVSTNDPATPVATLTITAEVSP